MKHNLHYWMNRWALASSGKRYVYDPSLGMLTRFERMGSRVRYDMVPFSPADPKELRSIRLRDILWTAERARDSLR